MAEPSAVARSAFDGLAVTGRHGRMDGAPGLTVAERRGLALASVIARAGRAEAVAAAVDGRFGVVLPSRPAIATAGDVSFLWNGPGQWLALAAPGAAAGFAGELARLLAGTAAVADQSDGRGVLRLSGPAARDVLMRGVAIDLHPRVFRTGDAAMTMCAHVDATLWQADDGPTFEIAVARGFCGSFWHWLEETAAPFGMAVVPG